MMHVSDLHLRAGGRTLVSGLNWQISAGQCWCVIGRNGAGKSTLLRTLAGLHPMDRGTVQMLGRPLSDWKPLALARERSFLPQSRNDAFGYRVLEAVLTARHPYHDERYWEDRDDHHAAFAALETMQVADLAERDVRTLSGGERQRVAIAALLAQDTRLLLMDEPLAALDLAHQAGVMREIMRLCRERGKAVVMVSHDLNLAHRVSNHALLLMGEGQWQAGTVDDVMLAPVLSRCLGHPIETAQCGKRTLFIPAEETAGPTGNLS